MKTISLNESQTTLLRDLINEAIRIDLKRKFRYAEISTTYDVNNKEIEILTSILELIL